MSPRQAGRASNQVILNPTTLISCTHLKWNYFPLSSDSASKSFSTLPKGTAASQKLTQKLKSLSLSLSGQTTLHLLAGKYGNSCFAFHLRSWGLSKTSTPHAFHRKKVKGKLVWWAQREDGPPLSCKAEHLYFPWTPERHRVCWVDGDLDTPFLLSFWESCSSGNSSSRSALPLAPCLLPYWKRSMDGEDLAPSLPGVLPHEPQWLTCRKPRSLATTGNPSRDPKPHVVGCYLRVGHLIPILVGHVNHEGIHPCKRGGEGRQEEDSVVIIPLPPVLPALSAPQAPTQCQVGTAHSPRAFLYVLYTENLDNSHDVMAVCSLLWHLFSASPYTAPSPEGHSVENHCSTPVVYTH